MKQLTRTCASCGERRLAINMKRSTVGVARSGRTIAAWLCKNQKKCRRSWR